MNTTRKRGHSGRTCAVKGCSNNSKKIQIWKATECVEHTPLTHDECPCLRPYSLHRFPGRPVDAEKKRRWITNLNLEESFNPKPHSAICGIHFPDGRPTEMHPYPVLHVEYQAPKKLSSGQAPPKKRCQVPATSNVVHAVSNDMAIPDTHVPLQPPDEEVQHTHDISILFHPLSDHTYGTKTATTSTKSTATQTDLPSMSAYDLDDKDCKFFTGLGLAMFWNLLSAIVAFAPQPPKFKLALCNQLLLVLMRLRLGLMFTDLGKRFSVSKTTACDIFKTWISVMEDYMQKNVVLWLPRDTLNRTRPTSFTDQLLPGDEVLADGGFTVDNIPVLPYGDNHAIQSFTRDFKQLPKEAVTETHRLANIRIHVERAMRLKSYKILNTCKIIPGSLENVDKISLVCAGLCNLQALLIDDDDKVEEMVLDDINDDTEDEGQELDRYMYEIAEDLKECIKVCQL